MEDNKIKNKAATKKAVKNKREVKTFGSKGKLYKDYTIKKDFKSIFIKGDTVYITEEIAAIYKGKELI